MNINPTATLWLIAYMEVTVGTYTCLLRDVTGWSNLFHYVMGGTGASLEKERSIIASGFLRKDEGDVLLMVDHDVQWHEGDLTYIARKALECNAVVGGLYPMRTFGKSISSRLDANGEFKIGTDQLVKAKYVAGGFMAIPKSILEVVSHALPLVKNEGDDYYPFFHQLVVNNRFDGEDITEFLSEDWSFCHRVGERGQKVLAALKPRLTHEGRYTYRMVDARSQPLPDKDITITCNRKT